METDRKSKNAAIAVIRWSARVFGVMTSAFFLLMFIGESLQSHARSGRFEPLEPIAAFGLALMGIYIVAMFLALKWERVGSLLGAAALGCFSIIVFLGLFPGRKGFHPVFLVFWVPILLYLLCWGLEGRGGNGQRRSSKRVNATGGSMHRTVVVLCALVLLVPCSGSAQALQSFEDLALRVNFDDQLQVEDQSGVKATGRLTRLTRDEIAIQTEAGEKRFTSDTVREVAVRGHALRKGALIGAGVFAVLGAVAVSRHGNAGAGALGAAPIGAGVGLAIGALTSQMRTIYRAPENRASVPRSRDAIAVQASLLEDLALRVNLDDRLRIEDQSGGRTTGRLTRLTADEITMQTDAGEKHFTRETVRQVAVRQQPLRMATLIGAGAGAVWGAVAACTGPTRNECADASIIGGAFGAGLGLAVGALIHRTTIVYPEPEKRTFVLPAISRGTVGVLVSRRW